MSVMHVVEDEDRDQDQVWRLEKCGEFEINLLWGHTFPTHRLLTTFTIFEIFGKRPRQELPATTVFSMARRAQACLSQA